MFDIALLQNMRNVYEIYIRLRTAKKKEEFTVTKSLVSEEK